MKSAKTATIGSISLIFTLSLFLCSFNVLCIIEKAFTKKQYIIHGLKVVKSKEKYESMRMELANHLKVVTGILATPSPVFN